MVKKHKKFVCVGCEYWWPVETAVTDLGGTNIGKLYKKASCRLCFAVYLDTPEGEKQEAADLEYYDRISKSSPK